MVMSYDRLYLEFLYYFNEARDYFECHEVMEELWLEEGRNPLLQGLLQVAVGLYHHRNGNIGGSVKLFTQAIDKLEKYPEEVRGIHLGRLLRDSRDYRSKLLADEPFEFYDLNIEIVDPDLQDEMENLLQNPPVPEEHS